MTAVRILAPAAVAAMLCQAPLASAQDAARTPPPAALGAVIECRAITDEAERLACYDRSVASLEQAVATEAVVVADREQVREARRGLFGLSLPDIKLFSGGKDGAIDEITDTVASFRYDASGRVVITLSDGARWQQVDSKRARIAEGRSIRIRRAALGSFFANIGDASAIRVKRIVD